MQQEKGWFKEISRIIKVLKIVYNAGLCMRDFMAQLVAPLLPKQVFISSSLTEDPATLAMFFEWGKLKIIMLILITNYNSYTEKAK